MTPTELTERHGPRSRHGTPPPEDGYHARMPSGLLLGQRHDTAEGAGRHLHREWVWYAPLGEMEPEYWGGGVEWRGSGPPGTPRGPSNLTSDGTVHHDGAHDTPRHVGSFRPNAACGCGEARHFHRPVAPEIR